MKRKRERRQILDMAAKNWEKKRVLRGKGKQETQVSVGVD